MKDLQKNMLLIYFHQLSRLIYFFFFGIKLDSIKNINLVEI